MPSATKNSSTETQRVPALPAPPQPVFGDAPRHEDLPPRNPARPRAPRDPPPGAERDEHGRHVGGVRRHAALPRRHDVAHLPVLLEAIPERFAPERRLI